MFIGVASWQYVCLVLKLFSICMTIWLLLSLILSVVFLLLLKKSTIVVYCHQVYRCCNNLTKRSIFNTIWRFGNVYKHVVSFQLTIVYLLFFIRILLSGEHKSARTSGLF